MAKQAISFERDACLVCPPRNLFHIGLPLGRTALRWIKRLTDEGIFVRTADPRDGRRVFIDLSDEAADGMANYIRAIERIGVTFS